MGAELTTSKLLAGKAALVTGGGRGIGRAIALELAAHGAVVAVNDLGCDVEGRSPSDEQPAREVAELITASGGQAIANCLSVSTFESAGSIVQSALDAFGRVDVLVNVAANARLGTIFDLDPMDWRDQIAVHLEGTFFTCRHAAPIMRAQGSGRIINMTSVAFLGSWGSPSYASAKAGVVGLTKAIATEGSFFGITANCLAPEAETRMQDYGRQLYTSGRRTEKNPNMPGPATHDWQSVPGPEWVGPFAAYLASDAAAPISGRVFSVRGANIGLWSDPEERWWLPGKGQRTEPWSVDELAIRVPALIEQASQASSATT